MATQSDIFSNPSISLNFKVILVSAFIMPCICTARESLMSAQCAFYIVCQLRGHFTTGCFVKCKCLREGGWPPVCICSRKLLALLIAYQEALKRCHEMIVNCIAFRSRGNGEHSSATHTYAPVATDQPLSLFSFFFLNRIYPKYDVAEHPKAWEHN